MARVHPGNLTSRVPDHGTFVDHVDEHPRNHDFEKKPRPASGGGRAGGGGGGRGGGRSDYVKCCYRCGEPGHFIRECPLPASSSARSYGRRGNDPPKMDVIDFTSGTTKFRSNPNTTSEMSTNLEQKKPCFDEFSPKNVDISPLLAKIELKEKELEMRDQEIDKLNSLLVKTSWENACAQAKNEEMSVKMKKLQDDLEKCRTDLSIARNNEVEIDRKYEFMQDVFEETKSQLYEEIRELQEANSDKNDEIMKLTLDTEQWRKAAKAIASIFAGDAEIYSKAAEVESLVLYYSNRAAKRVSHGKLKKALDDCRMAALLDPAFLKVCVTAGNCHLVLGEVDDALFNYKKCLESGVVCLDRRLIIEASDGLQKAEKLVSYIKQCAELLEQKTSESATNALEVITDALSISHYSEKLLELKGEALFMLRKYENVIEMCEQTLTSAEKNVATVEEQKTPLKLWRWSLMARSYFRMSKFDMALVILEKYEQLAPPRTKTMGPSSLSAATVCELLRCKNAGNEAYQSGKHREAVDCYSKAIQLSIESRPFTAICLCNRAAARQALGEIIDAIADCNLAIALDPDYLKAISRRARLHEKIRDYEHATLDLQRLVSLLEKRSESKYVEELTVARRRLSSVKRNKKGSTLDLYLILGLQGSASGPEIKKAYHKAALRHHPDKAGKFLAKYDGGSDGNIWKEIFSTIHEDADKLFKIIGEAYTVLSDATKRFNYNMEEAMKDDFAW